jgi:hypothetical protein
VGKGVAVGPHSEGGGGAFVMVCRKVLDGSGKLRDRLVEIQRSVHAGVAGKMAAAGTTLSVVSELLP